MMDVESGRIAAGNEVDGGEVSCQLDGTLSSKVCESEMVGSKVGGSKLADEMCGSKAGCSKATSMSGMSIEIRRSVSTASMGTSSATSFSQHPKACLSESFLRSYLKDDPPEERTPGSSIFTGNIRVLLFTAILFGMITIAQVVAAEMANSEALMADCVSMAVDALTYFLNIFVELRKGEPMHRHLQLLVPSVSIGILVYFTVDMIFEARETLLSPSQERDDVNPWIVGGFAVWGIIFDLFALAAFMRNAKADQQQDDTLRSGESRDSFASSEGGEQLVHEGGSGREVNMMAAFAHVGADFARSITTLVAALMIAFWNLDGPSTDAWACLLVSGMILLGACATATEVVKEFFSRQRARELPLLHA